MNFHKYPPIDGDGDCDQESSRGVVLPHGLLCLRVWRNDEERRFDGDRGFHDVDDVNIAVEDGNSMEDADQNGIGANCRGETKKIENANDSALRCAGGVAPRASQRNDAGEAGIVDRAAAAAKKVKGSGSTDGEEYDPPDLPAAGRAHNIMPGNSNGADSVEDVNAPILGPDGLRSANGVDGDYSVSNGELIRSNDPSDTTEAPNDNGNDSVSLSKAARYRLTSCTCPRRYARAFAD